MLQFFFSFKGRINRSKYWLYLAIYIVTWLLMDRIAVLLESTTAAGQPVVSGLAGIVVLMLSLAYVVAVTWSYLAVHVKRWHDRDKSGWWVLIGFIPIIGFVWTMIECGCLRGTEGDNRFGPDPLGSELASVFD